MAFGARAGLFLLPIAIVVTLHSLTQGMFESSVAAGVEGEVTSGPTWGLANSIALGLREGLRQGAELVAAGLAVVVLSTRAELDQPVDSV